MSKSDAIREILEQQPGATTDEIKSALKKRHVKSSDALINKIKYARKSTKRKRNSRGRSLADPRASKAAAIRAAWSELGVRVRPREVISHLAQRGIKVSSAQVSGLRKSARRRGQSTATPTVTSVSLEHLVAAKNLADRLGGIDAARTALANLARLIEC